MVSYRNEVDEKTPRYSSKTQESGQDEGEMSRVEQDFFPQRATVKTDKTTPRLAKIENHELLLALGDNLGVHLSSNGVYVVLRGVERA